MNEKICKICNNHALFSFTKENVDYHQCTSCHTLFSEPIDNSGMVGGQNEVPRNVEQNAGRIERLKALCGGKSEGVSVLDFGCGTGYLVKDLNAAGFIADGYDAFNDEFSRLPEKNKYQLCTMVECAEHLSWPFVEFDCINRSLITGGVLYVETSFVNVAEQENIPLDEFEYVSPKAGHSTIFSWHGLDILLLRKGFIPTMHINRHVRLYIKTK
jgi:SAM-dependent methyltransferase